MKICMHQRCTVCSRSGYNSIFLLQPVTDLGRILISNVQCYNRASNIFFQKISVDFHSWDLSDRFIKKCHQPVFFFIDLPLSDPLYLLYCCQKSCNSMSVKRSGFQMFRIFFRLLFQKTVHSGSATFPWLNRNALSYIQSPGSLRSHQALMSCKTKYIDLHLLYIYVQHSCRL